mmetsp:Transcript_864/g.1519  ORF Transcript_864/g.1519 Transcript_864/m.1519 type:complete len:242 (-) Transcript_864:109-834(-)|eukprot:CAMPEP_0196665184 /NCGR_PEP_ID=MMETSP1086-20130531/59916_1 /TAXON_ID=77921 /ORGANISM="Cyanoptyche  gloeocystis , Strain SAG4.97" /LENGTH=241 /DNA_ID=CAMNT_0042001803 /DNA_START=84 /DNA_END=809 /DNA_ORIENTATION=+
MVVGKLYITVGGCRKLKDSWSILGKLDPYVVVKVGQQIHRTRVLQNAGRHGSWNETFHFDITDSVPPIAHFTVKDEDVGKDDYVGELEFNFGDLAARGQSVDAWYQLRRDHGKHAGELELKIHFVPGHGTMPYAVPPVQVAGYMPAHASMPVYQPQPYAAPPAYANSYPPPNPYAAQPQYPPPPAYGQPYPPPAASPYGGGYPPAPGGYPPPPGPGYPPAPGGYPAQYPGQYPAPPGYPGH